MRETQQRDPIKLVEVELILSEISARVRAKKVSIATLCREAKISQSTFVRWKSGKMSPTVECLNTVIETANAIVPKPNAAKGRPRRLRG